MVVKYSGDTMNNPPSTVASVTATTGGMSKVFMLDKYFSELQKFWATEKRLQGNYNWKCIPKVLGEMYFKS